ncbi:hypothetical protein MKX01_025195 [Papaver californicum]|nr:hypothetical protein MKX01_025195 [Papaver californicum]
MQGVQNSITRLLGKLKYLFRKFVRRFARKHNLKDGSGHRAGFLALMSMLQYCYELGVKYVTAYAFSVDNFNHDPEEVKHVMDLMVEKIKELLKEESIVNSYGVRLHFIGNLKLLSETARAAAEKAMAATAKNNNVVLLICSDLERHTYMSVSPDPDILLRTSGANRLSNFLLWQSSHTYLYSPAALWPEISLWHLIWMVLNFQRVQHNLEKKRKQL